MRRWWFRGIRFRTLKKNAFRPYQDGIAYTWKEWDKLLNAVRQLQPGDMVWNSYCQQWTPVKAVVFNWEWIYPRNPKPWFAHAMGWAHQRPRRLGQIVSMFAIESEVPDKGVYYIYDLEHRFDSRCPRDEHFEALTTRFPELKITPFYRGTND